MCLILRFTELLRLAVVGTVLLGTFSGCTSSKVVVPVPVAGVVKVDGKPLDIGWVTFHPDESRGNLSTHLSFGEIKKDGSYELTTNTKPGAPPGFYKVVVSATNDPIPLKPPITEDGKPWQPRWLTHEKYTRPETTDLKIEVVESPAARAYDLELSK